MEKGLILPGTLAFDYAIANLPPPPDKNQRRHEYGGDYAYIVRPGSCGLMECVPLAEASEYVFGGEYDERLAEFPDDQDYNPDDYYPYEEWLEDYGLAPIGAYSDGVELAG